MWGHCGAAAAGCSEQLEGRAPCITGKLPFSGAPPDDRGLPDMHLAVYNNVVVFDHATKLAYVIAWVHLDDYPDLAAAYQVCPWDLPLPNCAPPQAQCFHPWCPGVTLTLHPPDNHPAVLVCLPNQQACTR